MVHSLFVSVKFLNEVKTALVSKTGGSPQITQNRPKKGFLKVNVFQKVLSVFLKLVLLFSSFRN